MARSTTKLRVSSSSGLAIFDAATCSYGFSQSGRRSSRHTEILRRHWNELIKRVWPVPLANTLFQLNVLSQEDLETLVTPEPRHQKAQWLLMMMLTRPWGHFVDFARALSETRGAEDLGQKLLQDAQSESEDDVYVSREALVMTVKDLTGRVQNLELELEDERKEKVQLLQHVNQVTRTDKGKSLIDAALHLDKARQGYSYECPYQWQHKSCLPHRGMFFNRFVIAEGRAIAADWHRNQLYVCDLHSEQHSWKVMCNTYDAGHIYRLFTVGDKCFGTFYRDDTTEQEQTIALYDVDNNVWTSVASMPRNSDLQWYGIVGDKEHIFVVGGWDATESCLDTVLIYDVQTGHLCDKRKMSCKRRSCSCVIVDKTLYTAGGFLGSNGLNTVEAMSLTDYSRRLLAPTEMYRCSTAVLCGQLVASGGTTMACDYSACSNAVSVLDPAMGVWLPLPNMSRKRFCHGMNANDNTLFVVGGDDCESGRLHDLNSIECLKL